MLLLLFLFAVATAKNYTDYHVLRSFTVNDDQKHVIEGLLANYSKMQFLRFGNQSGQINYDFIIPPAHHKRLVGILNNVGIEVQTLSMDFQREIDYERNTHVASGAEVFNRRTRFKDLVLGKYHSESEIKDIVIAARRDFPDITQAFRVGYSVEGRGILGLKIGKNNGQRKRAIYVDAGIHAREWLSPSTAIYIMYQLLTRYGRDDLVTELVDNLDWYILPLTNPDGYDYTMNKKGDRMWRKNRSQYRCNLWGCCEGVDLNRNFGFHWGESGTESHPCSEIYCGSRPFSEPEVQALRNFIANRRSKIIVLVSLHSFSQYWLVPYGYGRTKPSNFNKMLKLAELGVKAIRDETGANYTAGNTVDLLYAAAGAIDDWARGALGIPYSYTIELRPNADDVMGFKAGANLIEPTGREIYAGITTVAKQFLKKYAGDDPF